MTEFDSFVAGVLEIIGLRKEAPKLNEKQIAGILNRLNEFLYQSYKEGDRKFISKFHKFWKENHEKILEIRVDEKKCEEVAKILESIFAEKTFPVSGDVEELTPHQIANVRFFAIIQDFIIRFKIDPYKLAKEKSYLFNPKEILDNHPAITDEFLHHIGADSQLDKRHKFARLCAELLIDKYDGDAFNIAKLHDYDAKEILEVLVNNPDEKYKNQLGFSEKKAIIFIRDMLNFGVWKVKNPEVLDLPSDQNTMKVALRTGIVTTRIPLLASYLDIYCYQYDTIDNKCREAWRKVWEIWGKFPDNHRLPAPASFDFLIYKVGQNWNKPSKLPEVELFRKICSDYTKDLNPPKSISRYGKTGWERGKISDGTRGGGGISS